MNRRTLAPLVLVATSALALAGCASTAPDAGTDDAVQVVASTNVYGSIAEAIGGDLVDVTAVITSLSQDPHSYEASARDQLTVSRADLIVANGGGYDAFMDDLIDASGTDAVVLSAVTFSHDYPDNAGHDAEPDHDHAEGDDHEHDDAEDHDGHDHIEGFNEHVWYDPHTMAHLAEDIAHELGALDPGNASTYEANAAEFTAGIDEIEAALDDIAAGHQGTQIFVTEPVPLYLTEAAGLVNATPEAFSEAVEEGQDVPPVSLLEALRTIESGDIAVLIANAQTGGAETSQVIDAATAQEIPVLEFTELVPEGETYLTWMGQNVADLAGTLSR
ncbi:metal ABC transporter solute-binding protein, Zn/Mn family [Microbacterium invictum]|uniref:Zinc/manganese transport system substrate-binding protein n=1 Tax=Microbacterium invictum TaxID=515415 RepID=A0AA40SQU4_9MICO|nr:MULTISPECIES: zinc ABC transporter substrate-binding protein [Microbacterium]MBB4140735.1 zinc/manganese transport system substrate-binding protein [Microbacterium invictum]